MLAQAMRDQYHGLGFTVGQPAPPVKFKVSGALKIALFLLHYYLPSFKNNYIV